MTISFTQTTWYKGKWTMETVDDSPIVGDPNRILVDSDGKPHIAYIDKQFSNLKYAYQNDTGWYTETFESKILVGSISDRRWYQSQKDNCWLVVF